MAIKNEDFLLVNRDTVPHKTKFSTFVSDTIHVGDNPPNAERTTPGSLWYCTGDGRFYTYINAGVPNWIEAAPPFGFPAIDLTYLPAADSGTIDISGGGTDATIPIVSGTFAGLMSPTQLAQLDSSTASDLQVVTDNGNTTDNLIETSGGVKITGGAAGAIGRGIGGENDALNLFNKSINRVALTDNRVNVQGNLTGSATGKQGININPVINEGTTTFTGVKTNVKGDNTTPCEYRGFWPSGSSATGEWSQASALWIGTEFQFADTTYGFYSNLSHSSSQDRWNIFAPNNAKSYHRGNIHTDGQIVLSNDAATEGKPTEFGSISMETNNGYSFISIRANPDTEANQPSSTSTFGYKAPEGIYGYSLGSPNTKGITKSYRAYSFQPEEMAAGDYLMYGFVFSPPGGVAVGEITQVRGVSVNNDDNFVSSKALNFIGISTGIDTSTGTRGDSQTPLNWTAQHTGTAPSYHKGDYHIGGNTSRNTRQLWESTLTTEQKEQLAAGTLAIPANVSTPGDGSFARQWYYNQQSAEDQALLDGGELEYPAHLKSGSFVDSFALGDNTNIQLSENGRGRFNQSVEVKGGSINTLSSGIYYATNNTAIALAAPKYDADGNLESPGSKAYLSLSGKHDFHSNKVESYGDLRIESTGRDLYLYGQNRVTLDAKGESATVKSASSISFSGPTISFSGTPGLTSGSAFHVLHQTRWHIDQRKAGDSQQTLYCYPRFQNSDAFDESNELTFHNDVYCHRLSINFTTDGGVTGYEDPTIKNKTGLLIAPALATNTWKSGTASDAYTTGIHSQLLDIAGQNTFNIRTSTAPNFFAGSTYIGGTPTRNTRQLWESTLTEEQKEELNAGTLAIPANVSTPGDGSFIRQWWYDQQSAEDQALIDSGELDYPEKMRPANFTDTFTIGDATNIDLYANGSARFKNKIAVGERAVAGWACDVMQSGTSQLRVATADEIGSADVVILGSASTNNRTGRLLFANRIGADNTTPGSSYAAIVGYSRSPDINTDNKGGELVFQVKSTTSGAVLQEALRIKADRSIYINSIFTNGTEPHDRNNDNSAGVRLHQAGNIHITRAAGSTTDSCINIGRQGTPAATFKVTAEGTCTAKTFKYTGGSAPSPAIATATTGKQVDLVATIHKLIEKVAELSGVTVADLMEVEDLVV